ncbi:Rne/Rng family ribonuclease [Thermosipho atlanticus]|uniref:Ribonuclease G n=1 Tax=Thermosipho atlanticus DSM 15807 TaxID=1123380 RepID=A0A1M5SR03_9BACT|nr:Rne/Rng family ribonuclease [Thermosipho atlanticus]SHH40961.1 ribonuclease G [Thermosipho atlanticus DSM 15807]
MEKTIVLKTSENDSLHCAIIENNKLVEIFSDEDEKLTGNIYLGRVDRIVNALDAVFVNIGESKNGFLRKKDIPEKFIKMINYDIFKPKSKILVQVKKDPIANKGPQLTANISLAGRFLVIFPFTNISGVSKKIENLTEKQRLYEIANNISKEYNIGVVLRTAAEGIDEKYLYEEIENLLEKWNQIFNKFKRGKKAKLLHYEESSIDYILREKLTKDVTLIITNNTEHVHYISKYFKSFPKKPKIEIIDSDPFEYKEIYKLYKELFKRKINLPSGGEIIIDKTEALTVIDVNSKHLTSTENQQETALITNLEAVEEIFRQLRLRNIGGIIVIDFIDMNNESDKAKVLEKVNTEIKKDKSKIEIYGFTKLGLLELSRKRTVRSFFDISTSRCPICNGTGIITSPNTLIKEIYSELNNKPEAAKEVIIKVHPYLKGKINKNEIKKTFKINVHIHYTYFDPKSYEITWKI